MGDRGNNCQCVKGRKSKVEGQIPITQTLKRPSTFDLGLLTMVS